MKKVTNKGYTMVEMIVYLAIFTVISVVVINSFIVVSSSYANIRSNHDLLESGSKAMERMVREIRQAESIDVVNSILGVSNGALQLNSINDVGSPMIIRFNLDNGQLILSEGGSSVGNLLGQNVRATNLTFRRITATNVEAVKIELTLENTIGNINQTLNFYNTIMLRGAY